MKQLEKTIDFLQSDKCIKWSSIIAGTYLLGAIIIGII